MVSFSLFLSFVTILSVHLLEHTETGLISRSDQTGGSAQCFCLPFTWRLSLGWNTVSRAEIQNSQLTKVHSIILHILGNYLFVHTICRYLVFSSFIFCLCWKKYFWIPRSDLELAIDFQSVFVMQFKLFSYTHQFGFRLKLSCCDLVPLSYCCIKHRAHNNP